MPYYLRAGGYTTWLLLLLGVVLLVAAVNFLRSATPRRLAFLRALSAAYLLFTFGGIATNTTVVLWAVAREHKPGEPYDLDILFQGLGEAITPAGVGLTILGLVWLIIAIGVRRAHDTEA
ncbi:MAG: hypothetical protein IPL61_23660 [Myxococcales bacterium]|nr:hypothetical protein [Myxococcales bacterium]